jgi:hypothetical protein
MYGVTSAGTITNDILGFFGIRGANLGVAIDSLTGNQAGVLANLQDAFLETAMGRGTGFTERLMGTMATSPWQTPFFVPSPMTAYPGLQPYVGAGYAGGGFQTIDLAPGSSNIPIFSALFSPQRRMAGQFEARLKSDLQFRAAFEAQIGGRVIDDWRSDGVIQVQRFPTGYMPSAFGAQPMVGNIYGYLNQMNVGAMQSGYYGANMAANPFYGYVGAGLQNAYGQYAMAGQQGVAGGGWGPVDNSGPRGGRGYGSWNPNAMPGQMQNTNPYYESAHQAETAALLADPSLTVEDKVTLLIMLIMKKMDQDIERQAQYINSIQQQQSSRTNTGGTQQGNAGGAANGPFGQAGEGSSPSIDVETMKLKRMIDKRGQMFDMLRQIIDKYNETAKNIIQSIGR